VPDHQEALFLQASVLMATKEFDKAKSLLDEMGEKTSPEYYQLLASYYRLTGQGDKAGEILEKGLDKNPGSIGLVLGLARYYGQKKDMEKVDAYLTRAISISPEAVGLKFNLAWLYLGKKEPEKALALLEKLVEDHPDNDKFRVASAVLLMKGGQRDASVDMIKKGMAEHPEVFSYYALLSEFHLKANQVEEAGAELERFLALGDQAARTDQIKARLT
jgi:tetratricopeptide (TPR) repeat protein